MATYPKVLKPPRTYPSANVIMAMSFHYKAANPDPSQGQVGLTAGVAKHIGTIPAGSMVLGAAKHTITALDGTSPTLDIGTKTTPAGFVPSASLVAQGFNGNVAGTLSGFVAVETPVYALLGGTGTVNGEVHVVLPFYTQKD